jgi:coenzyme F420 biosynthesis associated uncharacterized protein
MEPLPAVDWNAAIAAGAMVLPSGPRLSPEEIDSAVADLRRAAAAATEHVAAVTELASPASAQIMVVDRANWLKACTQSAAALLEGVAGPPEPALTSWAKARSMALGGQAGVVLAVVATRILGQFDPFYQPSRLMLVAPNVVAVERDLGVVPSDFRLWVCLHEQTHRFQFGQAPWLREHLLGLIGELLDGDELKFGWQAEETTGARGLIGSPAQRQAYDQATAVMSLLEGHADVMMDRVGSEVVPSYAAIRQAFNQRRESTGWLSWVQKLFGLDLKHAQYREGAAFCSAVIEAADVATLNQAFSAPGLLPSLTELRDPQLWLHRI